VSTYALNASTGNYNSGILVEEVQKILQEAGVTPAQGSVITLLNSGIENFKKGYYTWAVRDFKSVVANYPATAELMQPFELLAQEKITAGEDNTPLYEVSGYFIHKTDIPYILGGLGIALIAFILMIVALLKSGSKHRPIAPTSAVPPVQPTLSNTAPGAFGTVAQNVTNQNFAQPPVVAPSVAPQNTPPTQTPITPISPVLNGIDLSPFAVSSQPVQPLTPTTSSTPLPVQPFNTMPQAAMEPIVVAATEPAFNPIPQPINPPTPIPMQSVTPAFTPAELPLVPVQPVETAQLQPEGPLLPQTTLNGPSFISTPSQGTPWTSTTSQIPPLP
jgi:hypothetical protein